MFLFAVPFGGALWMFPVALIAYLASLPLTWGYCYAIGCVMAFIMLLMNSMKARR